MFDPSKDAMFHNPMFQQDQMAFIRSAWTNDTANSTKLNADIETILKSM